MSGARVRRKLVLLEPDVRHGIPGIADVAGSPPEISTHIRSPLPHILPAVLAQAEDYGPARLAQRVTHFLINGLLFFRRIKIAGAAPVVLEIIDAPRRPG